MCVLHKFFFILFYFVDHQYSKAPLNAGVTYANSSSLHHSAHFFFGVNKNDQLWSLDHYDDDDDP